MMDYNLAKQLKDAGFPQEGKGKYRPSKFAATRKYEVGDYIEPEFIMDWVYEPTLSELIAACGRDFRNLRRDLDGIWIADIIGTVNLEQGKTPEEAVANLWLSLNKKDDYRNRQHNSGKV